MSRWRRLSHYWQHFIVAVLLGIGIETAIHLAHNTDIVRITQNLALDTSLRMFSLRDKHDSSDAPLPVLLLEDDMSAQSSQWGQDRPMTLSMALQLASHAFDRGALHVLLDVTFDDVTEAFKENDRQALSAFFQKYSKSKDAPLRHLYVARSLRVDPCFPHIEALETLRPSIWDHSDTLSAGATSKLIIHSVLPHYREDSDHLVRGWDLFGVPRQSAESTNWRFLPSPQLAYISAKNTAADQLHTLPWLSSASVDAKYSSRAAFASAQFDKIPVLSRSKFKDNLCADHEDILGCPVRKENKSAHSPSTQEESLHDINALLRPLPVEHSCRTRAVDLTITNSETLYPAEPHDLLFNRIVFDLPHWSNSRDVTQRGYFLRTPLTLEGDDLHWTQRLVAIGSSNSEAGDMHATPVGQLPGVLINLNAMQSLDKFGPISRPSTPVSLLVNGLIILAVAAVFSALSPGKAAALSGALLLGSMVLFHEYLLSRGIWIEFGAPMLGINLHRIIDGYLAKLKKSTHEKLQSEFKVAQQSPP